MINIIITIVTKIWNFDTVVGDRNGTYALQKLVCWWWLFDWSFAYLIAPVLTTISIILISNKIQTGDVLISAYQGCPGKWLLNECHVIWQYIFNVFMCAEQLVVPLELLSPSVLVAESNHLHSLVRQPVADGVEQCSVAQSAEVCQTLDQFSGT